MKKGLEIAILVLALLLSGCIETYLAFKATVSRDEIYRNTPASMNIHGPANKEEGDLR